FLQRLKSHADELSAIERPLPLADFNIYVFKGLKSDLKDLVTILWARADPVTYSELLGLVLCHEFLHQDPLNSLTVSNSNGPSSPTVPFANLSQPTVFFKWERAFSTWSWPKAWSQSMKLSTVIQ
ncbi:hypothetical protein CFOL_v3_31874, partial [Cephalotus follicularis]